ncbi:MAG TPA: hypothetical protein VLG44_06640 [Chlamydiales bacterium]|nr:hypothetical protein [Chlamydiales bacterium]
MTSGVFAIKTLVTRSMNEPKANKSESWELIRELGIVKSHTQARVLIRILEEHRIESGEELFLEEVFLRMRETLHGFFENYFNLLRSGKDIKINGFYQILIALGIACYTSNALNNQTLGSFDALFAEAFRYTAKGSTHPYTFKLPVEVHHSALELFPLALEKRDSKLTEELLFALLFIGNHHFIPHSLQKEIFAELERSGSYNHPVFLKVMDGCILLSEWHREFKELAIVILRNSADEKIKGLDNFGLLRMDGGPMIRSLL